MTFWCVLNWKFIKRMEKIKTIGYSRSSKYMTNYNTRSIVYFNYCILKTIWSNEKFETGLAQWQSWRCSKYWNQFIQWAIYTLFNLKMIQFKRIERIGLLQSTTAHRSQRLNVMPATKLASLWSVQLDLWSIIIDTIKLCGPVLKVNYDFLFHIFGVFWLFFVCFCVT